MGLPLLSAQLAPHEVPGLGTENKESMKNLWLLAGLLFMSLPGHSTAQAEAPAANTVSADYLIGPGDDLQIFVWRNPELTVNVPVKPDGRITTPLVENMVAVGKTTGQLARDIETVLAQYVRTPQVNVIVTTPRNVFNEIKAVGQLRNPHGIAYRSGITVLDVILAAGGLTDFAAGNRSKVVRTVDGKRTEIKVRAQDILEDGDLRTNIQLSPGDILIVPESRF
jgi:polysaccharide export outer membrane protein